jgi:hypothetical protein
MADLKKSLSQYFASFNELREELIHALEGWDTPVIVVFGPQNAGKSTLLERLSMVSIFPKGEGLCTRVPIRIRMRTGDESSPLMSIIDTSRVEERVLDTSKVQGDLGLSVQKVMESLITELNKKERGVRNDRLIQVELWDPDYPNIDLLDLPGMVVTPSDDDAQSLPEQTYKLVIDTIDRVKDRATFLAVREAGYDVQQSLTTRVLNERPQIKSVSMGVLTKCDKYSDKHVLQQLNASEEWSLAYGYVVTMNEPTADAQVNLQALAQAERTWFDETSVRREMIERGQAGCDILVEKLRTAYHAYLENGWAPHTISLLSQRIALSKKMIKDLGVPHHSEVSRERLQGAILKSLEGRLSSMYSSLMSHVVTKLKEVPLWDEPNSTFPKRNMKYQGDTAISKGYSLFPSVYGPNETLSDQLQASFQASLEKLASSLRPLSQEHLAGDKSAVKLGRFQTFTWALSSTLNQTRLDDALKGALLAEAHRFLHTHMSFDDPIGIIRYKELKNNLISACLSSIATTLPTITFAKELMEKDERVFDDASDAERTALNQSILTMQNAQKHLIELFKLDLKQVSEGDQVQANSSSSLSFIYDQKNWNTSGILHHLCTDNGSFNKKRADQRLLVSSTDLMTGDLHQIFYSKDSHSLVTKSEEWAFISVRLKQGTLKLTGYVIQPNPHWQLKGWDLYGMITGGERVLLHRMSEYELPEEGEYFPLDVQEELQAVVISQTKFSYSPNRAFLGFRQSLNMSLMRLEIFGEYYA